MDSRPLASTGIMEEAGINKCTPRLVLYITWCLPSIVAPLRPLRCASEMDRSMTELGPFGDFPNLSCHNARNMANSKDSVGHGGEKQRSRGSDLNIGHCTVKELKWTFPNQTSVASQRCP